MTVPPMASVARVQEPAVFDEEVDRLNDAHTVPVAPIGSDVADDSALDVPNVDPIATLIQCLLCQRLQTRKTLEEARSHRLLDAEILDADVYSVVYRKAHAVLAVRVEGGVRVVRP